MKPGNRSVYDSGANSRGRAICRNMRWKQPKWTSLLPQNKVCRRLFLSKARRSYAPLILNRLRKDEEHV